MKKGFLLMLAAVLLLCAGCKKEPDPTSIRLPDEMLNPSETTQASIPTLPPETTVPKGENPPKETRPTTSVEPDYDFYTALLNSDSGNLWLSRALGCVFSTAEELNLEQFCLNGISDISWDTVSPETAAYLEKKGFEQSTELQGMSVEDLDHILKTVFGIPLSAVEDGIPDSWVYVGSDHCYYSNHHPRGTVSDIEITLIEVTRDNIVQIFYRILAGEALDAAGNACSEEEMLLVLRYMSDDTWQVISNTPVPKK